jgi:hypothetical protein
LLFPDVPRTNARRHELSQIRETEEFSPIGCDFAAISQQAGHGCQASAISNISLRGALRSLTFLCTAHIY